MTVFDKHRACEKRNEKVKREAKIRRAKQLAKLPDQFTSRQCAEILNITTDSASSLIQHLCIHKELTFDPNVRSNRVYTKCPNT